MLNRVFAHFMVPVSLVPVITGAPPLNIADTAGGGQRVVIPVASSTGATGASAGGVAFTSFAIDDATHVSGILGAHAAGVVDIVVTNGSGPSTTGTGLFEYWIPAQLTGGTSYFDAEKGVTQVANAISQWDDQDLGNAGSQSTGGNKPTWQATIFGALHSVRFTPQKWLRLTRATHGATGYTRWFVIKTTANDTSRTGLDNCPLSLIGDSNVGLVYCTTGLNGGALEHQLFTSSNQYYDRGSSLNDGTTRLLIVTHSAANEVKHYSGTTQLGATQTGATSSTNCAYDSIGAGASDVDGFSGDVGAVGLFDNAIISGGDMTKLHKWAQQRFGAAA